MKSKRRPKNARDNRLLNTIEMRERRRVLRSWPYSMQIEVTTKCNFACIMCARDKYHGTGDNLTDDILDVVMRDIFPHCQDVIVSSFGEPLLYPRMKDIFEKIDPNSGLDLGFFTNFVLMTEEMAELIIKSGVGYINCSTDGATKHSYETIRKGGKWDVLCEKLRMFQQVKKRLGATTPRLNLCVVGSTLNVDEIPKFVEFAHEFGFDSVKYNHNMYVDDEKMDYLSLVHEQEKTVRMFHKGFQRAMELGVHSNFEKVPFSVDIDLETGAVTSPDAEDTDKTQVMLNLIKLRINQYLAWRLKNTWDHAGGTFANFAKLFAVKTANWVRHHTVYRIRNPHKMPVPHPIPNDAPPRTCGNPWTHVHVKSDGLVYPCCFSDEVMGDLRKQSFDEIWNGKKYQSLRHSMVTGKYWSTCLRSSCNWVEGHNSTLYGAEIELANPITELDGTNGEKLKVKIKNTGKFTWDTEETNRLTPVSLSYRMFSEKKELIEEGPHVSLPKPLEPGKSVVLELPIKPVAYAGRVTIKIDMVHERVTWFGERGNNAKELKVDVVNIPFSGYLSSWNSQLLKMLLDGRALTAGETITLPIRVMNTGTEPIGGPNVEDVVTYHWRHEDKKTYEEWEGYPTFLTEVLQPGEHKDLDLRVDVPRILETGRYRLEIDMKRNGLYYLSVKWNRPMLTYPVKVVKSPEELSRIPEKKANGKPYTWEPKGQCVSHTGNKGIW